VAREVTSAVACPVIGIGASPACDGQVLVVDDMLGMFERVPRFVRRFEDFAGRVGAAAETYASAVRDRSFPADTELYQPRA
jgi:3-methyl-2-oxobutanoate hydroxymethyltransferase